MNSKIILSLSVIAAVAAIAVGGTAAYFTNSGTSTSNTFAAGTLNLQLTDDNETALDNVTASFGGSGLYPGQVLPEQFIKVKNAGTINANHLDLQVTLVPGYDTALADAIIFPYTPDSQNGMRFGLTTSAGDSINMLTYLRGTYNDGDYDLYDGDTGVTLYGILSTDTNISLADIAALGKIRVVADSNSEGLTAGTEATLWIHPQIDTALTAQGGSVTADFGFALEQDASQY